MRTPLILGLLGVVSLPFLLKGQELSPAEARDWKITAEEAARKNPLKPDEENLKEGKVLFDSQCAMCHGKKGDGTGDLAATLSTKPADLTNPDTLRGFTDGALFAMLTKGKGAMPGLENRLSDSLKWMLVNYLRSLSGSETSPGAKPPSTTTSSPGEDSGERKSAANASDKS